MFTFSFSTAFADATVSTTLTEAEQAVYDAVVGPNDAILNARFETAWNAIESHVVSAESCTYTISAAAYAGLKAEALKAVKDAVVALIDGTSNDAATVSAAIDTNGEIIEIIDTALATKLGAAQFAIDYAAEIAKLDTVDVSAYSTEAYDANYTHQGKAAAIIADAKKAAAEEYAELDADSTYADYVYGIIDVRTIVNAVVTEITLDSIPTGVYELSDTSVLKTADAAADKAEVEANKAALKALVAKNVAAYQKNEGVNADADLVAAYTEMYTVRIDSKYAVTAGAIADVYFFASTKVVDNYEAIQELVTYAEKYKAEKDADGNLVRNAEAIDKIVTDAKKDAYNTNVTVAWTGLTAAKALIEGTTVESAAVGLEYAKTNAKNLMENWLDGSYYPAEKAAVEALIAEFNAKVDAATKTTEIYNTAVSTDLYDVYNAKIDAVKTKGEVNTALAAKTAYGNAYTAIQSYLGYFNSALDTADQATKTIDATESVVKAAMNKFYGEAGARTEAELKALKNDVLSIVDTLPTAGAQAAAKKAAQDAINALPKTVTLADEATVQAAVDATKAYYDLDGNQLSSTYTTALDNARAALYNAYRLDLNKKVVSVVKTDKAALTALKAEFEAAQKKNGAVASGKCLTGVDLTTIGAYTTVTTALDQIQAAEKDAVKKAINAIPINVTEADKATVEAARALYDAYVAEYTDYEAAAFDGNAADEFVDCYRELALAEAALGLNDNTEEMIIASVESLKLKASSTKGKGWIKVTWKVTGDTENVEGYQLYKSTKAHSGYKKCITTTKTSFKNTKNIEKGERYYYKVRAFVTVDGVKYYSDWSNKANRVAI